MDIGARRRRLAGLLRRFGRDETAATSIEYGLIAALIAIVIITAVRSVGTNVSTTFGKVSSNLTR